MVTTAFIGLGSNIGDRAALISRAITILGTTPGVSVTRVTLPTETKPIGPIQQPDYMNAVARIDTELGPMELLDRLQSIENQLGRVRAERWGPRTIDLDILIYGDQVIDHPRLKVPHPEIKNRPFIQEALKELQTA